MNTVTQQANKRTRSTLEAIGEGGRVSASVVLMWYGRTWSVGEVFSLLTRPDSQCQDSSQKQLGACMCAYMCLHVYMHVHVRACVCVRPLWCACV